MNPASYWMAAPRTPLVEKTAEILLRAVRERSGVRLVERAEASEAQLVLDVQPGAGREGFRIERLDGQTHKENMDER
jgi:hypothetical protein